MKICNEVESPYLLVTLNYNNCKKKGTNVTGLLVTIGVTRVGVGR